MYLYPWDALDGGAGPTLDRLRACGINAVKVATVYHSGKLLLPRNGCRRVFVPEDGAMYFSPGDGLAHSALRPPLSRFVRNADPLEEICRAAAPLDMELDAWAVCLHNRALADSRPEASVTNVFGDRYPHALCPMQPPVRAYLHALVADLACYPIRGIVIEALFWVPYKHYSLFEVEGVEVGPVENLLLSLCFCGACRNSFPALADLEPLVKSRLAEFFRTGNPGAEPAALRPFLETRTAAITTLAGELSTAARKQKKRLGLVAWAPAKNSAIGIDLGALSPHLDTVDWAYYQPAPDALKTQLEDVKAHVGPHARIELLLRPSHPDTAGPRNLAAKLGLARAAGIADAAFYNYGILPEVSFEWIRTALTPA